MIRQKNCDPNDSLVWHLRYFLFHIPDDRLTGIVSGETGDKWSAGSDLPTLDLNYLPYPMSLYFKTTDAGNDLDLQVTVFGLDQFGVAKEEAVTLDVTGGGSSTVFGSKVFSRVDRIRVDSTANNAVADTLDVGWAVNSATLYGLPVRIQKDSANGIADSSGTYRDTIKTVYRNGALRVTTATISAIEHAIKDSGPYAADDTIDVVLGEPYNNI